MHNGTNPAHRTKNTAKMGAKHKAPNHPCFQKGSLLTSTFLEAELGEIP
jgi:hypothetical protein